MPAREPPDPPDPLARLREVIEGLNVELGVPQRPAQGPGRNFLNSKTAERPLAPQPLSRPPVTAPEPVVSGEVKRRLAWGFLAAAILLVVFTAESGYLDRGREHVLPASHPSALVWSGDTLWVSDWFDQSVYRMAPGDEGLKVERRFVFPKSHIMALAVTGKHIYLADSWTKQFQRRRLDADLSLERAFPSPGPNPSALYYDGRYLWSTDKATRRLYQHALDEELSVLGDFPLSYAPVGFHVDGAGAWGVGEEPRLFYRHAPPRGLEILGAYELPELLEGRAPISGFALRGRKLWIALDGVNMILERPARLLKRRKSSEH